MKKIILSLLAIGLVFSACRKKSSVEEQSEHSSVDIYAVGYEKNQQNKMVAKLWKNGVVTSLTDGRFNAVANAVSVSGADVYVVGYEVNAAGKWVAKLWKNGVGTDLFEGGNSTAAHSVAVSGNDVYVVGYESIGIRTISKLWKNAEVTVISDGSISAPLRFVTVVDGDVYMTGSINGFAHLWKNGTASNISSNIRSSGDALAISENDVYVAGVESINEKKSAVLWKNGIPERLSNDSDFSVEAGSVAISGEDVYVVGRVKSSTGYPGPVKLWKNGVESTLTNTFNTNYFTFKIAVSVFGNDVYIGDGDEGKAKIWKNGIATNLTDGSYEADINSIFLVPKQ
ncbi:MAG: hypothetical protein JNM21_15695 [Taibaiella sp.]|nr:hypothetical protein [Taibaiella sp.]